jgi:hypothetical protein
MENTDVLGMSDEDFLKLNEPPTELKSRKRILNCSYPVVED